MTGGREGGEEEGEEKVEESILSVEEGVVTCDPPSLIRCVYMCVRFWLFSSCAYSCVSAPVCLSACCVPSVFVCLV